MGVTVSWVLKDPEPDVVSVPSIAPETEMLPPDGQGLLEEKGKLQVCPMEVVVHPDDVSGRRPDSAVVRCR